MHRLDGMLRFSREVRVERGVRQGCIISPLLFNLYSEFMMMEAMEGISFNGINITDIRYADDAVLMLMMLYWWRTSERKCRRWWIV